MKCITHANNMPGFIIDRSETINHIKLHFFRHIRLLCTIAHSLRSLDLDHGVHELLLSHSYFQLGRQYLCSKAVVLSCRILNFLIESLY